MMRILYFSGNFINKKQLQEETGLCDGSDPKLLLAGFEKFGKAFFSKPNGLFSFVIFDEENECWYWGRDRFGGKALYYTYSEDGKPVFSEKIKDLLFKTGRQPVFREELLEIYLSYSYIPGEDTVFQDIQKPLPGFLYCFKADSVEKERYFVPKYHIEERKGEEWEDRLDTVFCQIFSETPKGGSSLLSSGIDSAYLCKNLHVKDTYTADYSENAYSESLSAGSFSKEIGADHHSIRITPEEYLKLVPEVMRALEQPCGDASSEVLYALCRAIRKNTDTCYSGEAIDELFMGYYMNTVRGIPKDRTLAQAEYIGITCVLSEAEKKRFMKHYVSSGKMEYVKEAYALSAGEDKLNQAALADLLVWLNGSLLPNLYGIGNAVGLNVVTPYFDNRLYDITMRIPSHLKNDEFQTKKIFRKVVGRALGEDYSSRPKLGFPVPVRMWLRREDYAKTIKQAFLSDTATRFFNDKELIALYDSMLADSDDRDSWRIIWCFYCFIVWYDEMIATFTDGELLK